MFSPTYRQTSHSQALSLLEKTFVAIEKDYENAGYKVSLDMAYQ